MAIFTISSNTNYSAIKGSLANGDTIRIDTNTVRLTIDEEPLLTNITVDSPNVSGRCTINGAYDLSTWTFIAGTVTLIDGSVPAGCIIGEVRGGMSGTNSFGCDINAGTIVLCQGGPSGTQAHGCSTNNGTITTSIGGAGTTASGCNVNNGTIETSRGANGSIGCLTNNGTITNAEGGLTSNGVGCFTNASTGLIVNCTAGTSGLRNGCATNTGTITNCTGGSGTSAVGCATNNGTITNCTGGSTAGAFSTFGCTTNNGIILNCTGGSLGQGCFDNFGTIYNATGGSAAGVHGCGTNNSTVQTANGGSNATAYGINTNRGSCIRAFNNTGRAINISRGDFKLVDGPDFRTTIDQTLGTITTIYTINGPLHSSAVIPAGVTVIELSTGGSGAAFQLVGGGGLVY
jgi:hypothetical protein